MAGAPIDFNAPDLAARIEQLSQYDLDRLPFGIILLDREGIVQFFSETEARQSGYGALPLGKDFFTISRFVGREDFRGRIAAALEAGRVDLEFAWLGDFNDSKRELRVRVQSARSGGFWMFIERDGVQL